MTDIPYFYYLFLLLRKTRPHSSVFLTHTFIDGSYEHTTPFPIWHLLVDTMEDF